MLAVSVPEANAPEQLQYLGYEDNETGWDGSKGSCKDLCSWPERSFNWLHFIFIFFFLDDLFQDTLHADWHVPGPRKISVCGVRLSADFKGLGLLGCVHPVSVGFQCKCELSLGSVALLGLLSEIF